MQKLKEAVKEFLKPEWKKFVLPVIFIILFGITISLFYAYGGVIDKYTCEIISKDIIIFNYYKKHNISPDFPAFINQTIREAEFLRQEMGRDLVEFQKVEPLVLFLSEIDPALPIPCLAISTQFYSSISPQQYCKFYINKETCNCFNELYNLSKELGGATNIVCIPNMTPSIFDYIANILILFIEGYLISSVILFGYRRFKSAKKIKKK